MKKKIYESLELTADEGMVLTDGEHFCKGVLLDGTDDSAWREITEAEAEALKPEPEPEDDEEKIVE